MKKLAQWVIIGFVVVVGIGVILGEDNSDKSTSEAKTENQAKVVKTYKVNESIITKNLETTVTSVSEKSRVGSEYVNEVPSEGGTLIAVHLKYKNTSDSPLESYKSPKIKLLDPKGNEYDYDLGKTSTYTIELDLDRKIFSDLNPGITVKDAQVFEISKESYSAGGWKVQVEADNETFVVEI